jgi:hypothetical protein
VAELTACYVDYQCPACYRVWRWLACGPRGRVRPYSLDSEDGQIEPLGPHDAGAGVWSCSRSPSSPGITGPDAHARYVDCAFELVHGGRTPRRSRARSAGCCSGRRLDLDLDRFNADSERWRAEVGLWHHRGGGRARDPGVPTLVFDDGSALLVTLEEDVTDPDAAQRLLADLADLADQPVAEVRRPPE